MSINDKENRTIMEPLSRNAETSSKTVHRDEQNKHSSAIDDDVFCIENDSICSVNPLVEKCGAESLGKGRESQDINSIYSELLLKTSLSIGAATESTLEANNMQLVSSILSQLHGIFPEETSNTEPEEHILLHSGSAHVQDGKLTDALKTSENSELNDDVSFQKPASSVAGNLQTACASMQETDLYMPDAMTSHELDSRELISSQETDTFLCEKADFSPKVIDLVSDSNDDMEESSARVLDLICVDDSDTGVSCDPSTMTAENQGCLDWNPSGSGYERSQPTDRIILRRKGKSKQCAGMFFLNTALLSSSLFLLYLTESH